MATVYIPTPMRKFTNGQSTVTLAGDTVEQLFEAMEAEYPGIRGQLYDENAQLKRFIAVFVNGKDIRNLNQDQTPVQEQDEVYIVPAIAGGSPGAVNRTMDLRL